MTRALMVDTDDRIMWVTVDAETGRWLSVVDVPRVRRLPNGAPRNG